MDIPAERDGVRGNLMKMTHYSRKRGTFFINEIRRKVAETEKKKENRKRENLCDREISVYCKSRKRTNKK